MQSGREIGKADLFKMCAAGSAEASHEWTQSGEGDEKKRNFGVIDDRIASGGRGQGVAPSAGQDLAVDEVT